MISPFNRPHPYLFNDVNDSNNKNGASNACSFSFIFGRILCKYRIVLYAGSAAVVCVFSSRADDVYVDNNQVNIRSYSVDRVL